MKVRDEAQDRSKPPAMRVASITKAPCNRPDDLGLGGAAPRVREVAQLSPAGIQGSLSVPGGYQAACRSRSARCSGVG